MHGLRRRYGTGNATLEANLIRNLTAMMGAVLYTTFLALQKVYDNLNWDRCLDILVKIGVGPRTLYLLQTYWDNLRVTVKAGGYPPPPPSRDTVGKPRVNLVPHYFKRGCK